MYNNKQLYYHGNKIVDNWNVMNYNYHLKSFILCSKTNIFNLVSYNKYFLLQGLSNMNFAKPTPIQAATIPVALLGRDLCACAVTGSGKTNNLKQYQS